MTGVVISGTGLFVPPESISNQELVDAYNSHARRWNAAHQTEISEGRHEPLQESSAEFIYSASGICQRYVLNKSGILDPERMAPRLPTRDNETLSIQAEMAVAAAREAMQAAGRTAADVDGVLVACSNLQRAYPAIAVEVQQALGVDGYGFDMNVACSSATFALQIAADSIRAGSARRLLIVNPEICSAHLNFRDRDSHFIFGDVCTALMLEQAADCTARGAFEIVGSRLKTSFSNNIRNNRGFLNPVETEPRPEADLLFVQRGRKVFKEVIPLVARLIREQLDELRIAPEDLARLWLHQANLHMNTLIAHKVLGRKATAREAPVVLDEFANTSSAGSIIAFHRHSDDLRPGDMGVICSFGAGYSVGSVVVRRLN